jgi:hypothetical protein
MGAATPHRIFVRAWQSERFWGVDAERRDPGGRASAYDGNRSDRGRHHRQSRGSGAFPVEWPIQQARAPF